MLMGAYTHNVDAKGRVFIPVKFREELGDNFVITKGGGKRLYAYSMEEWERIERTLKKTPMLTNKPLQNIKSILFGNAYPCELDKQGRVLLPQILREYINVTKEAVVSGAMDRVEICAKENWGVYDENEEDDFDRFINRLDEIQVEI